MPSLVRILMKSDSNSAIIRFRATIAKLRQTIANKNKELAQLRADVPALVRAVSTLTMELQEARDEITALGNVTRLDSRRGPALHGDNQ